MSPIYSADIQQMQPRTEARSFRATMWARKWASLFTWVLRASHKHSTNLGLYIFGDEYMTQRLHRHLKPGESPRIWEPKAGEKKTTIFFSKIIILVIIKIISKFSPAWTLVFVYVNYHWDFHRKITVTRILGHGDELTELQRPFSGSAKKCQNLRQSWQNPSLFDLFSICLVFFVFFVFFFRFRFQFLLFYVVFKSNLAKSQTCKKDLKFFSCFFVCFLFPIFFLFFFFFPFLFSILVVLCRF